MDLWMHICDGESVNVGTFDGGTPDEARAALANLLVACAETLRSSLPPVDNRCPALGQPDEGCR